MTEPLRKPRRARPDADPGAKDMAAKAEHATRALAKLTGSMFGTTCLGGAWSLVLVYTGRTDSYLGVAGSLVVSALIVTVLGVLAHVVSKEVAKPARNDPMQPAERLDFLVGMLLTIPLAILAAKVYLVIAIATTAIAGVGVALLGWLLTHDPVLGLLAGLGAAIHAPLGQAFMAQQLQLK